jgi:hypothetical protein
VSLAAQTDMQPFISFFFLAIYSQKEKIKKKKKKVLKSSVF